ncbi:class I SAM-dependent methyltransferase [Limosilactobacillus fastidiosus]|uniref:Methyltransferase domain-containing protein n=1 Tax=Limosilactobacillus fastidiosus TaxID=2759855 RepID=A0A7W3YCB5_9LACO|nr:class I SAM-dependent methyltransferase [Limosilactobacillus fastidiosus]MBB1085921.1 methyltransferase domain-containing protein [Limosilactobacillus fastidiosus]MCD7085742.1 class I SAM-dependent methyltransferase [Limosilactobacillus fastidiosus]MCD7113819.1 class I SAM-dependent methyltransferase [Limosilactobacillus fastidiosus]MCD7115651.1 class I SAM-dependent methyltransferase [Limosilactobacillus fastidiosus]
MKILLIIIIILILLVVGTYCNTLFRGRRLIWRRVLGQLNVPEDSQVAILGLNYAGLFIEIAKMLKALGKVTGINIGNESVKKQEEERIKENRVADRTKIVDGSLANLPLESRRYDYVLSAFTFHSVTPAINRGRAIQEAVRVMKPEGILVIVDFGDLQQYRQLLNNLGFQNVRIIPTGMDGWWGGPWLKTSVLVAKR